jgi:transcriptional regulator with GAF, ATPase, and Fis domain
MAEREVRLAQTFVQLADTLVDGFDVIDLLTMLATQCVDVLGADEAGIMLADQDGVLNVVAASSERVRLLELLQIQNEEGPSHDCVTTGKTVIATDLAATDKWGRFAAEALAAGYRSVHALPLRLRDHIIGALNVFLAETGEVTANDLLVSQALADVATIAILQHTQAREAEVVTQQLQSALTSRIAIEQAKGVVAERTNVDMDAAFAWLRSYARNHNVTLSQVADEVVAGTLAVS